MQLELSISPSNPFAPSQNIINHFFINSNCALTKFFFYVRFCSLVRYFRIRDKLGLHARPAARLAELASKFEAEIKITKDNIEVNAKSIVDLLSLACQFGDKIGLEASGKDASMAISAISQWIKQELGDLA